MISSSSGVRPCVLRFRTIRRLPPKHLGRYSEKVYLSTKTLGVFHAPGRWRVAQDYLLTLRLLLGPPKEQQSPPLRGDLRHDVASQSPKVRGRERTRGGP